MSEWYTIYFVILFMDKLDKIPDVLRQVVGCSSVGWSSHAWHFHHPTQTSLARTPHHQGSRQIVQEDTSDPHWHPIQRTCK